MTLAEVLVLAKKYEGDHLYSEAVNYYKASLDRNMSDAERSQIQLDLAFCLRVEKKYDEALDYARKAKNLGREISPGLWILLNMQK
jgi:tetratricopeptide (TPR) repeat protein